MQFPGYATFLSLLGVWNLDQKSSERDLENPRRRRTRTQIPIWGCFTFFSQSIGTVSRGF